MKRFILLLAVTIIISILWLILGEGKFDRQYYINQKVLENATPFDVTIDTELLNSLKPANEQ